MSSSQIQRKSKYLRALEMVRAQMAAPPLSNSDNVVGELDVLPSGNPSVFLESEDGVDVAVKEPETIPGSVHVAVAAGDLLEASFVSSLESGIRVVVLPAMVPAFSNSTSSLISESVLLCRPGRRSLEKIKTVE